jgi:hypothetical protein
MLTRIIFMCCWIFCTYKTSIINCFIIVYCWAIVSSIGYWWWWSRGIRIYSIYWWTVNFTFCYTLNTITAQLTWWNCLYFKREDLHNRASNGGARRVQAFRTRTVLLAKARWVWVLPGRRYTNGPRGALTTARMKCVIQSSHGSTCSKLDLWMGWRRDSVRNGFMGVNFASNTSFPLQSTTS